MTAPAVHQVLATLGYGDAIGHEVLGIQKVLRAAGSDLDQILQMTSFIVDLPANGQGYVAVRKKILTRPTYTSATIGVSALMIPGLLLEVQCTAATP